MRLNRSALCLLLLALLGISRADAAVDAATVTDAPLVKVEFYGEALCPYCVEFTLKSLAPLYDKGVFQSHLTAIAQVDYIPWGNARLDASTGNFQCQHGQKECDLDAVFSCAINAQPDGWFPFVHCVETHAFKNISVEHLVGRCADEQGLNADTLLDCAYGEAGRQLQLQAAHRTHSLRPAHQGVPWVLVNGIPLEDGTASVFKYICAAYTGTRPDSCFELSGEDDAAAQAPGHRTTVAQLLNLRGAENRRLKSS